MTTVSVYGATTFLYILCFDLRRISTRNCSNLLLILLVKSEQRNKLTLKKSGSELLPLSVQQRRASKPLDLRKKKDRESLQV